MVKKYSIGSLRASVCFLNLVLIFALLICIPAIIQSQNKSPSLFGQAGNLDTSFNGNGVRIDGFGNGVDEIHATALQTDGKIIVAGRSSFGSRFSAIVARYNSYGSFDDSFNGHGKVAISSGMSKAYAVAVQSDGKIVIAGTVATGQFTDFAVVRLNPNGTFDTTFGSDGRVSTAITLRNDTAYTVAIQADGKIVVGGTDENPNLSGFFEFALVRYNADGSLDNTFGVGGKVTTLMPASSGCLSIVIQPDGKIVAAGSGGHEAIVARYDANGNLDPSFDGNGIASISFLNFYSVALQSDGKIVAAGSPTVSAIDFAVVRFNSNGTLDSGFDSDGIANVPESHGTNTAYSVMIGTNNKITAIGGSTIGAFAAARFMSDGSLDSSFGKGGSVLTPLDSSWVYPTFPAFYNPMANF